MKIDPKMTSSTKKAENDFSTDLKKNIEEDGEVTNEELIFAGRTILCQYPNAFESWSKWKIII